MQPSLQSKKNQNGWLGVIGIFLVLCLVIFFVFELFISSTNEPGSANRQVASVLSTETETIAATVTITSENTATPSITPSPTLVFQVTFEGNSNVRVGPGLNFPVAGGKKAGDTAVVYARNEDSTWLLIDPTEQLWVHISVAKPTFSVESLPLAPTMTPTTGPTQRLTATQRPTATPIPAVSLEEIYENQDDMTELQFSQYKNTLPGKPVRELVTVGNVADDGRVVISGPWSPWIFNVSEFCVVLTGVPADTALNLDGGEEIFLEAKIDRIVGDYNYYFNCEYALILVYQKIEYR